MAVLRRTLASLAIVFFAASVAYAQSEQGRITGRVADDSGAALPGTTVTIVSARLAEPIVLVADEVGQFNSPPLPPGTYTVVFEIAGFETKTRTGLDLRAGEVMTLDGHLPVASVKETVEVVAPAPPPPGPDPVFEAPKAPQTIPVPAEVLASVCGPGQADAITLTVGRILGHRDEKNRTLFGAGDILVLDSGAPNGLAPGQNYVVRRRFRVGNQNQPAKHPSMGLQTAGLIQVVKPPRSTPWRWWSMPAASSTPGTPLNRSMRCRCGARSTRARRDSTSRPTSSSGSSDARWARQSS